MSRPSRRSVEKRDDDSLTITPDEIDEIISLWYDAKQKSKELEAKESEYRSLIMKVLDLTQSDAIKGKTLMVQRRTQKRRMVSKSVLPPDIFERYAKTQEISFITIKKLK